MLSAMRGTETPVMAVRGLTKVFGRGCSACSTTTGEGMGSICAECRSIVACNDVSFDLYPGEILGIVGESGSGKSTVVRLIYLDQVPDAGSITLAPFEDGTRNLAALNSREKRWVRNHLMGMVYQNPLMGLKLEFSAGANVAEKLLMADWRKVSDIRGRATQLMEKTQIPVARMDEPPKGFSGGMQQRVQIAKALANNPPLLLLDEVTTGLDVSVQAEVLDLIRSIQRELNVAMLVVSHDFSVIRMLTDRTIVMRHGRIVEAGLTDQVIEDPQHPYTQLLINSLL